MIVNVNVNVNVVVIVVVVAMAIVSELIAPVVLTVEKLSCEVLRGFFRNLFFETFFWTHEFITHFATASYEFSPETRLRRLT